jgi:hypothetical protein
MADNFYDLIAVIDKTIFRLNFNYINSMLVLSDQWKFKKLSIKYFLFGFEQNRDSKSIVFELKFIKWSRTYYTLSAFKYELSALPTKYYIFISLVL